MSRDLKIIIRDDLTGAELPEPVTVRVGWEGRWYQLDLGDDSLRKVEEILFPLIESGTPLPAEMRPPPSVRPSVGLVSLRARGRIMRAWAAEHGFEVTRKGNSYYYSAALREAFERALAEGGVDLPAAVGA